jgi:hypothetical protein
MAALKSSLTTCPRCGDVLKITEYTCSCGVVIRGDFIPPTCLFCRLTDDEMKLLMTLLTPDGYNQSSHSMRRRIHALRLRLLQALQPQSLEQQRETILQAMKDGKIDAATARKKLEALGQSAGEQADE